MSEISKSDFDWARQMIISDRHAVANEYLVSVEEHDKFEVETNRILHILDAMWEQCAAKSSAFGQQAD